MTSPRLAAGAASGGDETDLAREMLQMLLAFMPEVRNKVEEQLVESSRKACWISFISFTAAVAIAAYRG